MKKKFKQAVSLGLVACMAVMLTSCGNSGGSSSSESKGSSSSSKSTSEASMPSDESTGDTIKLGSLWPLTGGSATIGQHHADGAQAAIDEINANGGVISKNGAKIELVLADTQSQPDQASIACERLITEDEVPLIIGAYNSTCCISATETSQKYKVPFLSMGGVATAVTERGYDYVWRINNTVTYDVVEMIKGLDQVLEDLGEDTLTYALIYENSDWGSDNAKIWKEYADERGWECVLDEPVENGQTDMTSQVLKIKESNADVVNVSFYTDDAIVFTNAMYANEVNPRLGVWSVGGGWQDSTFLSTVSPEKYMYNFVQDDWDVSGVQNKEWIKEVAQMCQDTYGYAMDSFFAQGWTAAYVAYYALEAAASLENTDLQEAINNLEIYNSDDERALLSGYTAVIFDEKGQNTFNGGPTAGTIVQYQGGENDPVALYPTEHSVKGNTAVLPVPDFSER